jgi:hypothetical protein
MANESELAGFLVALKVDSLGGSIWRLLMGATQRIVVARLYDG